MRNRDFAFALLFLALTGCGRNGNEWNNQPIQVVSPPVTAPDPELHPLKVEFEQKKDVAEPIDILVSIDNSPSMAPYLGLIEADVRTILNELISTESRLAVVKSTENEDGKHNFNFYLPHGLIETSVPGYGLRWLNTIEQLKSSHQGDDERGVEALAEATLGKEGESFFRSGRQKILMVFTDADDGHLRREQSAELATRMAARFGGDTWQILGFGSPEARPCPEAETRSTPVLEGLVSARSGNMHRICERSFYQRIRPVLESTFSLHSEFSMGSWLRSDWRVEESTVKVTVDGKEIPRDQNPGFEWDMGLKSIRFLGPLPQTGAKIEVELSYWN